MQLSFITPLWGVTVNPQKCSEISETDKHKDDNTPTISSNSLVILQRNYEYLAIVGMKFAIYKNVTLHMYSCVTLTWSVLMKC